MLHTEIDGLTGGTETLNHSTTQVSDHAKKLLLPFSLKNSERISEASDNDDPKGGGEQKASLQAMFMLAETFDEDY